MAIVFDLPNTQVLDNERNAVDVSKDLLSVEGGINYKSDLFEKVFVCLKYPMFYVEILKDVLREDMPNELPKGLLGSIVECHVRGILPERYAFAYHDVQDREVDYVNIVKRKAVEISVSNKKSKDVHFHCLGDDYHKILLTKDAFGNHEGIDRVPFYEFLYYGLDGSCERIRKSKLECSKPQNNKKGDLDGISKGSREGSERA